MSPITPCASCGGTWSHQERCDQITSLTEDDLEVISDDPIAHPAHYTSHPSGIECIEVVEHMSFNLGNVIKYLWRADEKGNPLQDLQKAAWYLNREIQRRKTLQK